MCPPHLLGSLYPNTLSLKCLLPAPAETGSPSSLSWHQAFGVSCWAPAHREQPRGPFSLSPDLGIQAGQARKSGPVFEFVGLLLTWAPISFLQSANITNICREPHSGQSDLYKTSTAFVNTFTEAHRAPGTGDWGIQWRAEQTETCPLKKLKSQGGQRTHWEGDLWAEA